MTLPTRITDRIDMTGDCWTWAGAHNSHGYAVVWWQGRMVGLHRLMCAQEHGEPEDGQQSDHLCRNRGCVRPSHLEWVTPRQNTGRGTSSSAATVRSVDESGVCKNGHDMTEPDAWVAGRGGRRECRRCRLITWAKYRERNREKRRQQQREYQRERRSA